MRSLSLILLLTLINLGLFSQSSLAEEEFLSPEQAFQFVELIEGDTVILQWQIAEKYYLYQNRIKVLADGAELAIDNFPEAKLKYDEYFGEVGVYYHFLELPIQVGGATQLEVHYQGCADAGLCYPPQTSIVNLEAQVTASQGTDTFDVNASDFQLLGLLTSGNALTTLSLFFLVGIITAFAGCSYPMFPILSKIIVGEGKDITRAKAFSLSLAYVLPIAVVYAILGIVAGSFGSNLSNWFQTPLALIAVAAVLVAMALSMFGLYELQMPNAIQSKFNQLSSQQKGGSYLSAISMGILSAFIVSACTVPPIVAAITYIAQTGDILLGASAMFLFGLGLGFPLLLLGLSASWLLPKAGAWMHNIQKVMGVFLLSAAIYIVSRIAPEWLTHVLWTLLAASVGLVLIINSQKNHFKILGGLCFALAGSLAMQLAPSTQTNSKDTTEFQIVSSLNELDRAVENSQKPVFIDYYADWCTSCVKMKNKVYPLPNIQAQLNHFTLIKIDLTEMTAAKEALMRKHQVVGPPLVLFLSTNGEELRELRITGEVNAEQFSSVLDRVITRL